MRFELGPIQRRKFARRAIFVGVNVMALALSYAILVAPIRILLAEGEDAITDRYSTLARYEAVASRGNDVREYALQVENSNARGELIDGKTEGVVNANLQARLKTWAENTGVAVRSIQALPAKSVRGALLNGARIEVTGALEAIHALVREMETNSPLLLVTSAVLRQQAAFWQMESKEAQNIEAQFEVYGGASPKER